MTKELGRLERVDLRDIWKTEAKDFTPWLAQERNLELLGDTIGIDLELEAQEKDVGPYRADILCKDTSNDSWVLIENQLEATDHRHLGQILTYAAGLNAVTLVWICERFTDEHRATLAWLNEITGDEISFFGLEVELWRIGNSSIAPKFNVVVKPNEWTKGGSIKRIDTAELSDTKKLQYDFWAGFREYVLGQKTVIKPTKPRPQHWMVISIGRSYFHLSTFMSPTQGMIGVSLWITGPNKHANFRLLHDQKQAIEREMGHSLGWFELTDKKSAVIRWHIKSPAIKNKDAWPDRFVELLNMLETMYKAFAGRIKLLDVEGEEVNSAET